MKISHQNKKKLISGFSLLELLVVIAIIAILVVIGVVAYSSAQRKARDARRRANVKAMQDGFEQYFADNSSYDTGGSNCSNMREDTTYFPSGVISGAEYTCVARAGGGYCVCADLDGTDGNATNTSCNFASGGGYYCLTNLQ